MSWKRFKENRTWQFDYFQGESLQLLTTSGLNKSYKVKTFPNQDFSRLCLDRSHRCIAEPRSQRTHDAFVPRPDRKEIWTDHGPSRNDAARHSCEILGIVSWGNIGRAPFMLYDFCVRLSQECPTTVVARLYHEYYISQGARTTYDLTTHFNFS